MQRYSIIDGRPVENDLGVFVKADAAEWALENSEEKLDATSSRLSASDKRVKELKAALQFYANPAAYTAPSNNLQPILIEGGQKARAALRGSP